MIRLALFVAFLTSLVCAADPPPEFAASGVWPGGESAVLAPGSLMSIYGGHLGPAAPCLAQADPKLTEIANPRKPDHQFSNLQVFPAQLCGVQVMIGDRPAEVIYVSMGQINFKVPQDSAETGTLDLRVVFQNESSAAVPVKAGFGGGVTISLAEPAYTGMPVWLNVKLGYPLGRIGYPSAMGPAGFGCNEVEVRRDGRPLPLRPDSDWMKYGGAFSGPPCGSYGAADANRRQDSLPLHLLYRFETPGNYEVRYTLFDRPGKLPSANTRAQSDWTTIEVLPAQPNQRRDWLRDLGERSASAGAGELISDILPSVLGHPEDTSFDIVVQCLYNAESGARRYALDALSYWPEDATSAKLLALLHSRGPTPELVRYLLRQPGFAAAHQAEIVSASLPYLESDSTVAIGGALAAVQWPPSEDPAVFNVLLRAAEHIVSHADAQNRNNVIQLLLGPTSAPRNDRRVHELMWKLAGEGYEADVAGGLARFRDPADLPKLAELMTSAGLQDRLSFLPQDLYQSFGTAAVPYLKTALHEAPGRFSERNLIQQLMAAGDPEGFQYALNAIAPNGRFRLDMLQAVKNQFPDLKAANDDAIRDFLKAHAGN
jgi:hypothetical protein